MSIEKFMKFKWTNYITIKSSLYIWTNRNQENFKACASVCRYNQYEQRGFFSSGTHLLQLHHSSRPPSDQAPDPIKTHNTKSPLNSLIIKMKALERKTTKKRKRFFESFNSPDAVFLLENHEGSQQVLGGRHRLAWRQGRELSWTRRQP